MCRWYTDGTVCGNDSVPSISFTAKATEICLTDYLPYHGRASKIGSSVLQHCTDSSYNLERFHESGRCDRTASVAWPSNFSYSTCKAPNSDKLTGTVELSYCYNTKGFRSGSESSGSGEDSENGEDSESSEGNETSSGHSSSISDHNSNISGSILVLAKGMLILILILAFIVVLIYCVINRRLLRQSTKIRGSSYMHEGPQSAGRDDDDVPMNILVRSTMTTDRGRQYFRVSGEDEDDHNEERDV